mmetsp:Transcript_52830/g.146694  ORF Transcript_52830/g.146694 Transcript_52830/m.146694 type:complete len:262 (-) Transcript_52830:256-1041(-)
MASLEAKPPRSAASRAESKNDAVLYASPESAPRTLRSAIVSSPASPELLFDHKALPEEHSRRTSKSDRLLGYSSCQIKRSKALEERLGVSEELIAMQKAMDKLGVESVESLASLDRGRDGAEQVVHSPSSRSGPHGRAKSFTAFGQAGRKGVRDATKAMRRSFSSLAETAAQVSEELSRVGNRSASASACAEGAEGKENDEDEDTKNSSPSRQRRRSIGKTDLVLNGLEVPVAFVGGTPSRSMCNPAPLDSPTGNWTGVGL